MAVTPIKALTIVRDGNNLYQTNGSGTAGQGAEFVYLTKDEFEKMINEDITSFDESKVYLVETALSTESENDIVKVDELLPKVIGDNIHLDDSHFTILNGFLEKGSLVFDDDGSIGIVMNKWVGSANIVVLSVQGA